MSTYRVVGVVSVSCWTEVEADSPEEAIAIAKKHEMAQHHIDGSYPENESWHFENDGTPDDLKVEE